MTLCLSAQECDDCDVCDVSPLYHYRRGGHYGQDGFYKDLYFDLEIRRSTIARLESCRYFKDYEASTHARDVDLRSEVLTRLQTGVTGTAGSSSVFYNGTTEALARLHAAVASARESGKESEIG